MLGVDLLSLSLFTYLYLGLGLDSTPRKSYSTPQKLDSTPQKPENIPQKLDSIPQKPENIPQKLDSTPQKHYNIPQKHRFDPFSQKLKFLSQHPTCRGVCEKNAYVHIEITLRITQKIHVIYMLSGNTYL